jgi:hypothetical protein
VIVDDLRHNLDGAARLGIARVLRVPFMSWIERFGIR